MGYFQYVGDPCDDWDEIDDFDCCDCCDCKPRRRKDKKIDCCCIKICNDIDIEQNANANGGDGGEGGDNNSAAAAAANGGGVSVAVPVSVNVEEDNIRPCALPPNGESGEVAEENATGVIGETEVEAEANAGNGGKGGDADINQTAVAVIENWTVVVCGDGKYHKDMAQGLKLESEGKKVSLKMDNGEVFLNGEKMDTKELEDGTKVFIVKQ